MPKMCYYQPMYTYCLFCETIKSKQVARQAEVLFGCRAICAQLEQLKWVQKQPLRERHDFLPGYVFLYTEEPIPDLRLAFRIGGVVRCLGDREDAWQLQGSDEAFALMLHAKDGVLGAVPVYAEGDRIRIKDGAFRDAEATILRVNRRKQQMEITLPFAGQQVTVWLEYVYTEPLTT